MKNSIVLMMVVAFAVMSALTSAQNKKTPNYRYAYSCDGYNQDRDDIAASAMTLAIFDRVGLADRIVHYHFNTNFGGKPTHAEEHRKSVLETAVLFGIIKEVDGDDAYFDVSRSDEEKKAAIEHLAGQIKKASKRKPLMIFAAGGVQVPYTSLKKAIDDGAGKKALQSVVLFLMPKPMNKLPERTVQTQIIKKLGRSEAAIIRCAFCRLYLPFGQWSQGWGS